LEPLRRELGEALDLEQLVRVPDDPVPRRHARRVYGDARESWREVLVVNHHKRSSAPRPPGPAGSVARHGERTATLLPLGVWRILVARSVRVGEVPSSNLGTPTFRKAGVRGSGFLPRESHFAAGPPGRRLRRRAGAVATTWGPVTASVRCRTWNPVGRMTAPI